MKPSTHYTYIFEDNIHWDFSIPLSYDELSTPKIWKETKEKLIEFHGDYVDISQKYKMGELYGQNYLRHEKNDIKNVYKDFLNQFIESNKHLSFFIYSDDILFPQKAPPFRCSEIAFYNAKCEFIQDYVYDLYDFKLLDEVIGKSTVSESVLDIFVYEAFNLGFDKEGLIDPDNVIIRFGLGVASDLFYPKLKNSWRGRYGSRDDFGLVVDNNVLAYRNAPRFNSYLRDLKDIFINKYEWLVEKSDENIFFYNEFETEEGILLDGKIIYQEDIDEGRVKIPDVDF